MRARATVSRRALGEDRQHGFTLIETLLAVTLLAVISLSAVSVFSMGLQIWKRTRQSSGLERRAILGLEKISSDLRGFVRLKPEAEGFSIQGDRGFHFQGKSSEIMIPVLLSGVPPEVPGGPGRKTYRWNASKQELCRSLETASDLYRRARPACEVISKNITKFRIRYRLATGITGTYSWYDEWDSRSGMPLAVEIAMEFKPEDPRSEKRTLKRIVVIPVGREEEKK